MRTVQISCLGNMGRFGNCLFQYAVARKYAQDCRCTLETPKWIGQTLFGLNDPPLRRPLPKTAADHIPWGRPNVDLYGYFQFQEALSHLKRSELKAWFKFKDEFRERYPKKQEYYIAAHVRRGDYLTWASHAYCVVNDASYLNACQKFGLDTNKLVWVREDAPTVDPEMESRGLGFLPDFFTLMNADVILRANSTFSWWAAVLGSGRVFSPIVEDKLGELTVDFVEGNWPRMCDTKNTGGKLTDLHLPE